MSMPKEPRQLMINLMYLVLTALLALNVSNEILHAFKVINESIVKSNSSIDAKNKDTYDILAANEKMEGKYDKVHPYKLKADEVKAEVDKMYKYLEDWKKRIVEESGGFDEKGEPKREDNIDATTLLLVERKGGDSIKRKLEDLRTFLLARIKDEDRKAIGDALPLKVINPEKSDNNPQGDWSTGYFHNMPTVAALTLFAKFQNDIRNSEAAIIKKLLDDAYSDDLKFDAIQAIAVPKTSYALVGQKVEASIMLAAYNRAVQPIVTASSGKVNPPKDGVVLWEEVASGVGLKTIKGKVSLNMGDHVETKDYEFQYMVGSTGASLQLDKMNVFYIGVPNPVTVTAAGYSLQDVFLSIDGANVSSTGPGKYDVNVDKGPKVMANIMAKKAGGGTEVVGSMEVRVKRIPDPIAKVGNKPGGILPSAVFKAQIGIIADLENFDFAAKFQVVSFEYSMLPKRGELIGPFKVASSRFDANAQCAEAKSRCKPGDKIFLDEIIAIGPDKNRRKLGSLIFTLQ